jgi:NTE family protein
MPRILCFLAILFYVFSNSLNAQENPVPKIGITLSGGGAKGIAHIGALQVFEEAGIKPDFISGNSMGSVVGGLYAAGYSADQLAEIAHTVDWNSAFSDQLKRYELPIEERQSADRYLLQFAIEEGKVTLPKGVVIGQNIGLLLSKLTWPVQGIHNFDSLPIPFRAVAGDLETGEAVTLRQGTLSDAIRASMSIPSIFEPVEIDGRVLVDGLIIRNLPVSDCRDMGAEFVIAVDVGVALYKIDELDSAVKIMEQTSSYHGAGPYKEQIALADIYIKPDMTSLTTASFGAVDTLIARGRRAALAALPEIKKLLPPAAFTNPKPPAKKVAKSVLIHSIQIEGLDIKESRAVNNLLQIRPGSLIEIEQLEKKMRKLHGSQFIRNASYKLLPDSEKGYTLLINAEAQSGDFVKMSVNYDSRYKAALLFNLTLHNRLINSSRLNVDLRVSENPALFADYQIYTPSRPNLGIKFGTKVNFYPGRFFLEDKLNTEFSLRHYDFRTELFSGTENRWLFSLGVGWEHFRQSEQFFDEDTDNLGLNLWNFYGSILRETYDRALFPRIGGRLLIRGAYAFAGSFRRVENNQRNDIQRPTSLVRLEYSRYFPFGKKIGLHWFNDAGWSEFSEENYLYMFYLGRDLPTELTHVPFYGLAYMEQAASKYALSGLKLRFELGTDYFIGLAGNVAWVDLASFTFGENTQMTFGEKEETIWGAALELGTVTRLGPAFFTSEYNFSNQTVNFVFHLGYVF